MRSGYEVTRWCNQQTQHWRGQLRGYEVTRGLCAGVRMRAQVRAWVRVRACVCAMGVTAQPRNSLGVARVSRLRVRATA